MPTKNHVHVNGQEYRIDAAGVATGLVLAHREETFLAVRGFLRVAEERGALDVGAVFYAAPHAVDLDLEEDDEEGEKTPDLPEIWSEFSFQWTNPWYDSGAWSMPLPLAPVPEGVPMANKRAGRVIEAHAAILDPATRSPQVSIAQQLAAMPGALATQERILAHFLLGQRVEIFDYIHETRVLEGRAPSLDTILANPSIRLRQ